MMPSTLALQALLLDLDGTVADTHEQIYQCLRQTMQTHFGCDFERAHWERNVGLPLHEVFAVAMAERVHEVPAADLVDTYRRLQRASEPDIKAFPGIPEALHTLKSNGIRLAIVTTKHKTTAFSTLNQLGLLSLFDTVVAGDDCGRYKPAPDPFLLALQRLNVSARDAAGIGDSPHDVAGSRAAGVLAVAACWGTASREMLFAAQPDRILEQPAELLSLMERMIV